MEVQATVNIAPGISMRLEPNTHHGKVSIMMGLRVLVSTAKTTHGSAGNVGGGMGMTLNAKVMNRAQVTI